MRVQTKREEFLNALTHGLGVILGIVGLIVLLLKDNAKTTWSLLSIITYGISIIILFLASTLYHAFTEKKLKRRFRIIDHISIYLLIAGTYTPVCLILLTHSLGWTLFYAVWSIAIVGTILKLFFTGKFNIISTLLYLVMGWLIVFDFENVSQIIGGEGIWLLYGGGFFYTVGIIFYAIEKIPYNHVIWHVFVLGGAICHFLMILWYVI